METLWKLSERFNIKVKVQKKFPNCLNVVMEKLHVGAESLNVFNKGGCVRP